MGQEWARYPPGARPRAGWHAAKGGEQDLTSAVGSFVRAVHTVLNAIAEAGHGDTHLGAQAVVLIRLASLGFTLWTWRQTEGPISPGWSRWLFKGGGDERLWLRHLHWQEPRRIWGLAANRELSYPTSRQSRQGGGRLGLQQ